MTPRQRRVKRRAHTARSSAVLAAGIVAAVLGVSIAAFGAWALGVAADAPDLDQLERINNGANSKVFAGDGSLLGVISSDFLRRPVDLERIPPDLQEATIAIEDANFYEHGGVDAGAIVRAAVENLKAGSAVQGGSTITQQLVKNIYTGQLEDRDLKAKIQEAKLAEQLDDRYPKDKILEMYLNSASYGTNNGRTSIGVDAAAQTYFSKPAKDLDLTEAALIAGLPQAPSLYNPIQSPEEAKTRRNEVLMAMAEHGYITEEKAESAASHPLALDPTSEFEEIKEPYFFDYVTEQLIERYGVSTVREGGLRVHTTIDPALQEAARSAMSGILSYPDDPSSAVVTIDPANGHILAMASAPSYEGEFNLAAQGHRQPGSSFKTMVLAAAVRKGIDPDTTYYTSKPLVLDDPTYGHWEVSTYGGTYAGTETLRAATLQSDNTVYAQLDLDIGPEAVRETAYDLGIKTKLDAYPAEALGGLKIGVTPLEMAGAYATLASGGIQRDPVAVTRVEFPDGRVAELDDDEGDRVMTDGEAAEVTSVLSDNIQAGTGVAASTGCPAAGKTGTTDDFRDAWFVGYTPKLATSVWVGYPDEQRFMTSVHGISVAGGTFPAQIWHNYMTTAAGGYCGSFPVPTEPFVAQTFDGAYETVAPPPPEPTTPSDAGKPKDNGGPGGGSKDR